MLERILLVACAGYWFGNSGVGLAALWLSMRPLAEEAAPLCRFDHLTPVSLHPHRALLRGEDGQRIEVFRDEMSASRWAALKRHCLGVDP